jgi:riboflavin synthase
MFTGLIEEIGRLQSIHKGAKDYQLVIEASAILNDVNIGDSIAVNGVCLTVTTYNETSFVVDVMPETIKATSLHALSPGSKVNLERAMTPQRRFGGHFVSGHVDGTGTITRIRPERNAVYFMIETKPELLKYMVPKGSVAVDGISLTVVDVTDKTFSVSIIPHTLTSTILHTKQVGDLVNLECDMLAKYMERLLDTRLNGREYKREQSQNQITLHVLKENGFA